MPKKKDTIYSSGNNTEKSILSALKDITHSDAEAYFIIWKYAPELLPNSNTIKSFEDLQKTYKNFENRTEQSLEKALFKEDVQALKAYIDFKKNFFADNETSELKAILSGINLTGGDDADDFEMKL